MTFKKLTRYHENTPLYVRIDQILYLYQIVLEKDILTTVLYLSSGESLYVNETIEEILP